MINNILNDLKDFMMLKKNFEEKKREIKKSIIQIKIKKRVNKYPIFWLFYLIKNSDKFINNIYNKHTELQERCNLISFCLKQKNKLTNEIWGGKITKKYLENELNENEYSLKLFVILCYIYDISFIFLFNNGTYFMSNEDPEFIIQQTDDNKILNYIQFFENNEKNKYLQSIYLSQKRINKMCHKLKSNSAYKKDELIKMCENYGIEVNEDKKKQELYDLLDEYCINHSIF
uniref:SAP domain-containing protein n=1 Tax=viral metagenome TaxID=1070528 RepID=A0A6C0H5J4_9ZZZZ